MTRFIGLGHYSRTGKDTLANHLVLSLKRRKIAARKQPFAWKLKEITYDLYSWAGLRKPEYYDTTAGEAARDVVLPELGMTPVELWVKFGTPAVRKLIYDKTWLDYVLKTKWKEDVIISSDVRFPNEVEGFREVGGTLIKVVRPGISPRKTVADQALVDYDGWDLVIGNSGKLEELYAWGKALANWIRDGGDLPSKLDS